MSQHSLSQTRVFDAAGNLLQVVDEDERDATLRYADGTLFSVPLTLLERRNDGSVLVPMVMQGRSEGGLSVPVAEERIHVDKRTVNAGGVHIRKSVHVRDEQVEVPLIEECIEVERVPLGVVVQDDNPPGVREEGDTMVIPVLEERLVVQKQLVLKEELHVRRVRKERIRTITETVRSEQVDVSRSEDDRQARH